MLELGGVTGGTVCVCSAPPDLTRVGTARHDDDDDDDDVF
jgi:hypothetical protein